MAAAVQAREAAQPRPPDRGGADCGWAFPRYIALSTVVPVSNPCPRRVQPSISQLVDLR